MVVNKPVRLTSFSVVEYIREISGVKKVGHTGTLDPRATGILPICLGRATKLTAQLMKLPKYYEAEIVFGLLTDTADAEGVIQQQVDRPITESQLTKALEKFLGPGQQIPPMTSALHWQGQRLYDLARQGLTVERPCRPIEISALSLVSFDGRGRFTKAVIRVRCSAGTYLRVLAEDIARSLETVAYLGALKRLAVGPFDLANSLALADFPRIWSKIADDQGQGLKCFFALAKLEAMIQKEITV